MGIKKEIKQTEFRNERQKGIVNLVFSHAWLKTRIKKYLQPYGITMQQFNVLRILNGQYPKPITTSVIRDRMLDKMSDASRIVERLHKKGWVKRQVCESDRRLVDIVITETGRNLIAEADKNAKDLDSILDKLSLEEVQKLNELLDKMRE